MGTKLGACSAVISVWKCGKKDPVHHKRGRKCEFQFRKVTKKGAFPNETALLKLLYLRITELYKKWNGRPLNNWALVRNQLDMDENYRRESGHTKTEDSRKTHIS